MRQAHWYLSTRIQQAENYDITVDQSRYCLSIIRRYLDTVDCAIVVREHTTPLPLDFVPTVDDNSVDENASSALATEFNLDFASFVGTLIYLALLRTDIIHAVNKLAKFTRRPDRKHFEALVHIWLCYWTRWKAGQSRFEDSNALDSKSAIAVGNSFRDTKHTRHITRRYHCVRVGVDSGRFSLWWIDTDDMLADIGTKQTPGGPRHELLTNTILVRVLDSIKARFTKLVQYKRGDNV